MQIQALPDLTLTKQVGPVEFNHMRYSRSIVLGMVGFGVVSLPLLSQGASQVQSMGFSVSGDTSVLEIKGDSPITFQKQENTQDKQIVLELKDAKLGPNASRKLDTSSFNSPVSLVSPYQLSDGGQEGNARIVIQLREPGAANVETNGNVLKVSISRGAQNGSDAAPVASSDSAGTTSPAPAPEASAPASPASSEPAAQSTTASATSNAPVENLSSPGNDKLKSFMDTRDTQKFSGRPITLQVKDADLADVFRLIAEASGFNIVVADDVRGRITLSLVDVPWDQILDLILHTQQLGAERSNNVLRIVTLTNLTREKQQELQAKLAAQANAPRITQVFPINYADLSSLSTILGRFGTATSASAGAGNPIVSPQGGAIVQSDNRTNSIIVQDIPENIERMKKLIEILDTQTPQVLIEAKIVEASEGFTKNISGSMGIAGMNLGSTQTTGQAFASFNGGSPGTVLVGGTGSPFATSAAVANNSGGSGLFGLSPSLSFISNGLRLNLVLQMAEVENSVRVVSSPRTVVLNKETATITQGQPVLVPGETFVAGVGRVPTSQVQSANLGLTVLPTVTNDGGVLMQLNLTRNVPANLGGGQSGVADRTLTTKVLVPSGTTLVIGGVYTMRTEQASSGFPILRKIPIIGHFFGTESSGTDKAELFFFITPKILNEKQMNSSSPIS